jgi:hypothetical protein
VIARLKNFQEVLQAAIEDILEFGFDNQERVDRWMRELRIAAERSMISPQSLEQQLRDGLAAVYRRQVEEGVIFKRNPGVERFTLEMVKPRLRAELDRRIVASANLIKLNRAQAIDETLRRFQGWSSAIPPGGVSRETRGEVKAKVKKSLASLPFEERRVLIDQGHKLTSSLSKILATDGGAIAGVWHSHWRQAGYDFREDHKERDQRVFLVRDSWAHKAGYVKRGRIGYVDESTEPGQEVFCRCYYQWLYALKDLPEDMLTAKGKAALASVQGREEVMSARQARADSAGERENGRSPQGDVAYSATWPNRPTRCQRCSMFVRLAAGIHGNACTAVEGEISAHGHCQKFALGHGIDLTSTISAPVDRDHHVPGLWRVAPNADRMWVDRVLPRVVDVGGVTFDPAELFWARGLEAALFDAQMTKTFVEQEGRLPDPGETKLMRAVAARHGEEAEQRRAREMGLDWMAWRRWVAGEKVRADSRKVLKPVEQGN